MPMGALIHFIANPDGEEKVVPRTEDTLQQLLEWEESDF